MGVQYKVEVFYMQDLGIHPHAGAWGRVSKDNIHRVRTVSDCSKLLFHVFVIGLRHYRQ